MNDIRRARFIRKIAGAVPDLMKSAMQGMYLTEFQLGQRRMADRTVITLKIVAVRECPPGVDKKLGVNPTERLVVNPEPPAGDNCA